jgi:uncharacterized hydrophobic protein (TIGR00271 family)
MRRFQDRLAMAFGILPADRTTAVTSMLARSGKLGASYWLQLALATAIATFGLVLGSTAVVIGAMLISPLMGPILELGMGLVIASPFLVIRSLARVVVSIVVVVGGAALITILLPFHEVTAEIAARTSPTVLDLLVAVGCAIAAAYAVVRAGSDTAATAAGTAIGIALVPPLCVIGYGVGTRSWTIAAGSSLLFTANMCAILLFAVLSFLLLGYGQIVTSNLEQTELQSRKGVGIEVRVARSLGRLFASKYGPVFRLAMPLLLVVAVYVPLHRALAEVTWQISVRSAIQKLLDARPGGYVRSSVSLEAHHVDVRVVVVGAQADAAHLRGDLLQRIETVARVRASVEVVAVPDTQDLRAMEATMRMPPQPPPPPDHADMDLLHRQTDDLLARTWPAAEAGPLLGWTLRFPPGAQVPVIAIVSLGAPIGPAGERLLAEQLSSGLGQTVTVSNVGLPFEPAAADADAGAAWAIQATRTIELLAGAPAVHVCVQTPADARGKSLRDSEPFVRMLRDSPALNRDRVSFTLGPRWDLRLSMAPCASRPDGGAADAAADGP